MTNQPKTFVERLEERYKARCANVPLVRWENLTPATAVIGHRVAWTDGRKRACVGIIRNKFPGYVAVSAVEVEGLAFEAVCTFAICTLRWPGVELYTPEQIRRGEANTPTMKRWQVANDCCESIGSCDADTPREAVLTLAKQRGWGNWTSGHYMVREIGQWQPVTIDSEANPT